MINFYIKEAESNVAGPIEVRGADGSLKETIHPKSPKMMAVIYCGRCDERLEGSWNSYPTPQSAAMIITNHLERGDYGPLFRGHGSECSAEDSGGRCSKERWQHGRFLPCEWPTQPGEVHCDTCLEASRGEERVA